VGGAPRAPDLGAEIDLLLDAGMLPPSAASTLADARGNAVVVLRAGPVDPLAQPASQER
jgi:tRNA A37 threonylcarbamoyladenosine synthetase subunit TsaC/SUA5/YrdC